MFFSQKALAFEGYNLSINEKIKIEQAWNEIVKKITINKEDYNKVFFIFDKNIERTPKDSKNYKIFKYLNDYVKYKVYWITSESDLEISNILRTTQDKQIVSENIWANIERKKTKAMNYIYYKGNLLYKARNNWWYFYAQYIEWTNNELIEIRENNNSKIRNFLYDIKNNKFIDLQKKWFNSTTIIKASKWLKWYYMIFTVKYNDDIINNNDKWSLVLYDLENFSIIFNTDTKNRVYNYELLNNKVKVYYSGKDLVNKTYTLDLSSRKDIFSSNEILNNTEGLLLDLNQISRNQNNITSTSNINNINSTNTGNINNTLLSDENYINDDEMSLLKSIFGSIDTESTNKKIK